MFEATEAAHVLLLALAAVWVIAAVASTLYYAGALDPLLAHVAARRGPREDR